MENVDERLAEGLQQAIQNEIDGYHFYLMAAQCTGDEKGKEIFQQLASEELEHISFLKAQYRSVKETGKPDARAKLGRPTTLTGPHPIFSPAIKQRIGEAHYEMSALSIGIQLELSSQAFYREQAERAGSPLVRDFYGELSDWEGSHYRALLAQQDALKEDYWAEGGFSPF